ncbi:hypothetical protein B0H14DRAFT_2648790 [Mycena olivaceomarginata]|nr:hypothetical protein B0H14DRAFT_2648790 [Mycena olivaceomarginata]
MAPLAFVPRMPGPIFVFRFHYRDTTKRSSSPTRKVKFESLGSSPIAHTISDDLYAEPTSAYRATRNAWRTSTRDPSPYCAVRWVLKAGFELSATISESVSTVGVANTHANLSIDRNNCGKGNNEGNGFELHDGRLSGWFRTAKYGLFLDRYASAKACYEITHRRSAPVSAGIRKHSGHPRTRVAGNGTFMALRTPEPSRRLFVKPLGVIPIRRAIRSQKAFRPADPSCLVHQIMGSVVVKVPHCQASLVEGRGTELELLLYEISVYYSGDLGNTSPRRGPGRVPGRRVKFMQSDDKEDRERRENGTQNR